MSGDEEMLVRTTGGDVIRRKVVDTVYVYDTDGRKVPVAQEPETYEGEYVQWTFGDDLPRIIKTQ